MKKIYYTLIFIFLSFINKSYSYDVNVKEVLLDGSNSNISNDTAIADGDGISALQAIFAWLKTELMAVVSVIAIAVFIFIGIKIATAKGNPEEFKKAWLHFVYAIIGIFIVFVAYGAVVLISSLSL